MIPAHYEICKRCINKHRLENDGTINYEWKWDEDDDERWARDRIACPVLPSQTSEEMANRISMVWIRFRDDVTKGCPYAMEHLLKGQE